jgi:hypothetical protein
MMEAFFFPLYELLLRGGKVDQATVQLFLLVFGAGCWVAALLVFFLDRCVAVVRGSSFLGYRHEVKFSIDQEEEDVPGPDEGAIG